MNITDDIKQQILNSIDIVDVVSEAIPLKKRGVNHVGKCPFHQEKTASFNVSSDRGIYKCFGCGKSGNAITFLIEFYGMTYPEAVKELAKRAGVRLVEDKQSKITKTELTKKEIVLQSLEAGTVLFSKQLETNAGKIGLTYFQNRGFSKEIIKNFRLGFSSDSWDGLINSLSKKFPNEILFDAGLVIKRDDNKSYYDRFRGRAMFPITDTLGKVVGFGARRLNDDDSQPKYINSPQTMVYDKSHILYGIFQAKNEIRNKQCAILTEGYIDVISLHQGGFTNAIASSGTALTTEQLKLLNRFCNKLYIVYDADNAGIHAAERGLEMALEQGFEVLVVSLPEGEDPDSLIKKLGPKVFQSYLNDAVTFIDFKIELAKKQHKTSTPAERSDLIRSLIKIIAKIPDRLQHDEYIKRIANKLSLSEIQLSKVYQEKGNIEKLIADDAKKNEAPYPDYPNAEPSLKEDESIKISFDVIKEKLLPEENLILKIAIQDNDILKKCAEQLVPESFFSNLAYVLMQILVQIYKDGKEVSQELVSEENKDSIYHNYLTSLLLTNEHISENWTKYACEIDEINKNNLITELLARIELHKIENELESLKSKTNELTVEEQLELIKKVKQLSDKRAKVKSKITIK